MFTECYIVSNIRIWIFMIFKKLHIYNKTTMHFSDQRAISGRRVKPNSIKKNKWKKGKRLIPKKNAAVDYTVIHIRDRLWIFASVAWPVNYRNTRSFQPLYLSFFLFVTARRCAVKTEIMPARNIHCRTVTRKRVNEGESEYRFTPIRHLRGHQPATPSGMVGCLLLKCSTRPRVVSFGYQRHSE